MDLHALAALHTGDAVTITVDGRSYDVTVQRTIESFGDPMSRTVKVGFGPGRWNREVSASGIVAGHYSLTRPV